MAEDKIAKIARYLALAVMLGACVGLVSAQALNWSSVAPEYQKILTPLASGWENMDDGRKRIWLEIAKRHATLDPVQQERLQQRMRHWASLPHADRARALEQYKKHKQLTPQQQAQVHQLWLEYDSLAEEVKEDLRNPVKK